MTLTRYGIREWGTALAVSIILWAGCFVLYRYKFPVAALVVAAEHADMRSLRDGGQLGMHQLRAVGQIPVGADVHQPPFGVDVPRVRDQDRRRVGEAVHLGDAAGERVLRGP